VHAADDDGRPTVVDGRRELDVASTPTESRYSPIHSARAIPVIATCSRTRTHTHTRTRSPGAAISFSLRYVLFAIRTCKVVPKSKPLADLSSN